MNVYTVITIFPEMFSALQYGVVGSAIKKGLVELEILNLRDFSLDKRRRVDETPYGGGPGMVMMVEPLYRAINFALSKASKNRLIITSPQGKRLDQKDLNRLAKDEHIIFVAGRYEGIDERLYSFFDLEEYSVGDYVLTGGELPIMTMLDGIIRLQPNVLGNQESLVEESFMRDGLDFPHYTKPEVFAGQRVPSVLLSGDHRKIDLWRQESSKRATSLKRPDLLKKEKH